MYVCIWKRERKRQRFFILWFTPQLTSTTGAAPGRSKEPGTSFGVSHVVVRVPNTWPSSANLSQTITRELDQKCQEIRYQLAPIWNTDVPEGSCTCYSWYQPLPYLTSFKMPMSKEKVLGNFFSLFFKVFFICKPTKHLNIKTPLVHKLQSQSRWKRDGFWVPQACWPMNVVLAEARCGQPGAEASLPAHLLCPLEGTR